MARHKQGKVVSMRKVRDIMRLWFECGLSERQIAHSCSLSRATVRKYLRKIQERGASYEEIKELDEVALCRFLRGGSAGSTRNAPLLPDWAVVHKELSRKGVTVKLLWEEYKEACPEGYQLTQFYELYNQWKRKLSVTMRQSYKAGETMFVDYAGQTVEVRDPATGTVREAQIFVSVLGASNYTFAMASWDQSLASWLDSHVRAFEYYGGVARTVVCDNLKTGVTQPCRYEPDTNPSYHDLSVHYGTAIVPTRVRKPRDKAKAESAVLVVERWILACLRKRTFFSLEELNTAIGELLEKLNSRHFKKLPGSRRSLFLEIERPALLPLPVMAYEFAQWKRARVNIDYHVELLRHYYSVPYQLVHEEVKIRFTSKTVEVFCRGRRVAAHARDDRPGQHSTLSEHMPPSHREYLEWTPSRIVGWAKTVGEHTALLVGKIMETRMHPEQGYRSCLGVMRLGKRYSPERLEAACERALALGAYSYKSVRSILEQGLEGQPLPQRERPRVPLVHSNVRGGDYYR
jgi:transposase